MASKLERHSLGSDVITTGDVLDDPEVREWLKRSGIPAYPIDIRAREGDPQGVKMWRLVMKS